MVKVDLVTGFLGSGKTTFIKKYARYLMEQGENIGILENDFGAINVDMMLLRELESENCELEMVAGGCDKDCYRRRFRTKLIAMGMCGYDRVLIEPSGIFDVDDFFDALNEEPLDKWYQIGNVITVVDACLEENLSEGADYILASEAANAGCILLSRTQQASEGQIKATVAHINRALEKIHCKRTLKDEVVCGDWEAFTEKDYKKILESGYQVEDYEKMYIEQDEIFQSLFLMDEGISPMKAKEAVREIFGDPECGQVFRIKGFLKDGNVWQELNATAHELTMHPLEAGQDVLIVIGEQMNEEKIRGYLKK